MISQGQPNTPAIVLQSASPLFNFHLFYIISSPSPPLFPLAPGVVDEQWRPVWIVGFDIFIFISYKHLNVRNYK